MENILFVYFFYILGCMKIHPVLKFLKFGIQGGLRLTDCYGGRSSDIPKRYTGAHDTTFACRAQNNWIPKCDGCIHTYIQTISEVRKEKFLKMSGTCEIQTRDPTLMT